MGNFLDKVGLQHFVEKIKSLLSGYLPLSGGTMTGDIVYDKITVGENQIEIGKTTDLAHTLLATGQLTLSWKKVGPIKPGEITLNINGLSFTKEDVITASYTSSNCKSPTYILTDHENEEGLIANTSNTLVKELSDDQVDKLLAGDTSTISDSKYYVSGANLGRFAQNVAKDNSKDNSYTIIKTNRDVKITTSKGEVTIPASINYHIYEDYKITDGKNYVRALIQSGYAQNGNKYFDGLSNLSSIDVSKLNISNIKDLSYYFRGCSSLYGLNIEYWDTKEVRDFSGMFTGCSSLTELRLYFWDTRKVTRMNTMFAGCINLRDLRLEGWNTQSVTLMGNMFAGCSAITSLYLSENFGRMGGSVGSLDLSALTKWTDSSVQTLLSLYNRKANGMSVITIKLSSATKEALGTRGIQTMTARGYTIA